VRPKLHSWPFIFARRGLRSPDLPDNQPITASEAGKLARNSTLVKFAAEMLQVIANNQIINAQPDIINHNLVEHLLCDGHLRRFALNNHTRRGGSRINVFGFSKCRRRSLAVGG